MDEGKPALGIAPWLEKRTRGEKCFSTEYTEAQCSELRTIASFYGALCWQYEHQGKTYPIFFSLTKKNPEFFEEGFCPVTDFMRWQNYLDKTSPFYNALKSILAYLCSAQLSVIERLRQPGHHYDPGMMLFEELKCWAVEVSYVKSMGENWQAKLQTRRLFLAEIIGADKLLRHVPEYTDALYKCIVKIDKEMMPCVNAQLALRDTKNLFLSFKGTIRLLLTDLSVFIFHLFRNSEYQSGECSIVELQNPILRSTYAVGKECEATFSGKLLLRLITSLEMQEVFQDDLAQSVGCHLPCQNNFVNEDGNIQFPKEWSSSSGKNPLDTPVGILSVFKNNLELMNQFMYLHALTQKVALFFVIFQAFTVGKSDLRYTLKEMREVIQHYKTLHNAWLKNIQDLYSKAENYLVKTKHMENAKEVEQWKQHFSAVRNIYQKLEANLLSLCHGVYDLEKVLCECEPVMPLNDAREALEKPLTLMRYFMEPIKSPISRSTSQENLFSPIRSASNSRAHTPKK